ncbi:MAG TPA: hypothetical protein VGH33_04385 [Isosphaeraceae bacterium]
MPKIYRSMKQAEDGKPVVEASAKGLGVRVTGVRDVDLDDQGNVVLDGKGMSVAPELSKLLPHLIPRRLRHRFPKAAESPGLYCFTMGVGSFSNGPMTDDLELQVDSPSHGVVAPRHLVPLDRYQADLASTRDAWTVDES